MIACSRQPERYAAAPETPEFTSLNILDQKSIVDVAVGNAVDVIIHAAAMSQPALCEQHPVRARQINVEGSKNVLSVGAALKIPVVYISTDLVFDGNRGSYVENDGAEPRTEYGCAKLQAEQMIIEQEIHDQWVIMRSSLMFGIGTSWTNGYPQFAIDKLERGEETVLFTDQYRSPVFVDDVARAIRETLDQRCFGEIFHIAGPERINRVDFVRRYCAAAGISTQGIRPMRMDEVPEYRTKVADVSLNADKILRKVGFRPTQLEDAWRMMHEAASEIAPEYAASLAK